VNSYQSGVSLNLLSAKDPDSALAITLFVNQHSAAASFIAPGVLSAEDLERALTEIRRVVNECCYAGQAGDSV
jgi:hypothetical protein